ncbi:MAG: hypothetical protein ACXWC9_04220 [Pseudobdellovibrionaceae bacterium]
MQTKFIINHKDRQLGPLTENQITKMLALNQIFPTDYLYDEEKKDWVVLSERFDSFHPPEAKQVPAKQAKQEEQKAQTVEAPAIIEMPAATPPSPAIAKEVDSTQKKHAGKIHLSGGVGTFSIQQVKAGQVSLKLKSGSGLDLPLDLSLTIQSAPAASIRFAGPETCRAGEDVTFELTAFDAFENPASDFSGSLEVICSGKEKVSKAAQFEKGLAKVTFNRTLNEQVIFEIKANAKSDLKFPAPTKLMVQPNVPVKLIAEGPTEVQAGENFDLKITALDAFGNVVTDFNGEIDLEVEAQFNKAS